VPPATKERDVRNTNERRRKMKYEVSREQGTMGIDERSICAVIVEAASVREAIEIAINSPETRIDGSDFSDWEWRESANEPILAHPDTDPEGRYGDYWMAMEIEAEDEAEDA